MDSVKIPTEDVPPGLKQCEQILKRANELKKVESVVAYWCCFSAAQKALNVKQRTKEETLFLMSVIDALEQMKAILANNEAITSEAAGAALVEAFALKVFMSADNDDRAGITGKATIRKFVVAGQFIEVLKCFEAGMTDEMEQKLQYARWKAADGAKALREGRTPASGPPIPESENDINPFPTIPTEAPTEPPRTQQSPPSQGRGSFSSQTRPQVPSNSSNTSTPIISPRPSPSPGVRPSLPGLRTSQEDLRTPTRNHSTGSGAWSTVATPGLPEDESELHFPTNRPDIILPSAPPMTPPERDSPGDKKNVRFMGPDGAPLSPASTHITVSSYDAPPPPPPTDLASPPGSPKATPPKVVLQPPPQGRPRGDSSASSSSRSGGSGSHNTSSHPPVNGRPKDNSANVPIGKTQPSSHTTRPPTNSSITVPPPPPPSLASYPMHPPSQPQPHGLGLSSPQPQPQSYGPTRTNLSRREVETVQKHAKWAVSAMEFDDYETARNELRKALNMLGG
uniref:Vacuolar protein sorting-associated protein VTA1 n=2 Tax=Kwoniella bestiolae CBS 10118 TaxID=1296100 RepID=A0A1B9G7K7_9TREE|nr:vacuolar protein sorting-associated protein VTA1 [Kwoniella bestiolae CBS 10118]OCF26981.1 vacuolar protein sorting-associated protein VTA1 [Kwoniella bestiolae CBS 10118]